VEGKIAASLLKAAEKAAAASKKPGPKAVGKPAAPGRPAKEEGVIETRRRSSGGKNAIH
jgi:hypothetical protein